MQLGVSELLNRLALYNKYSFQLHFQCSNEFSDIMHITYLLTYNCQRAMTKLFAITCSVMLTISEWSKASE